MIKISSRTAKIVGDLIGVDWDKIDSKEFLMGLKVELEHGSKLGKKTNITKDNLVKTGRIALAHLLEVPDYYTRLKTVEGDEKPVKEIIQKIIGEILD